MTEKVMVYDNGERVQIEISKEVYDLFYGSARIVSSSESDRLWRNADVRMVGISDFTSKKENMEKVQRLLDNGYVFKAYNGTTTVRGYYSRFLLGKFRGKNTEKEIDRIDWLEEFIDELNDAIAGIEDVVDTLEYILEERL